jgi:hypothetical protein
LEDEAAKTEVVALLGVEAKAKVGPVAGAGKVDMGAAGVAMVAAATEGVGLAA